MEKYSVRSLGEYMNTIAVLAKIENAGGEKDYKEPEVLWFRGMDYIDHPLIPSLFREKELVNSFEDNKWNYTKLHYAEDFRTQHYIAKNYHYFSKTPSSRVEWLEVMQHHEVRTRVLDWSESGLHSLIFALEAFLDGKKYSSDRRKSQVPGVWVLKPRCLNGGIFRMLLKDEETQDKLADELEFSTEEKVQFKEQLKYSEELLRYCTDIYGNTSYSMKKMQHLENIVNLSTINDEVLRDRSRLRHMLCRGEMFPVFYLLSRIYSDGLILEQRELPPLAVVQPYHCERIKAQKGVFTVFPYYKESPGDDKLRELGVDPNAMQYNEEAKKCLYKIEIRNPEEIAYQLLSNGITTSWLYPELPIVGNDIEQHRVF